MKQLLIVLILTITSYTNGYMPLLENVVIKNSKDAYLAAKVLQDKIATNRDKPDFISYQQHFKLLVEAWKKAEVLYVAGEINDDAIDLPFFIDIYHNLKSDVGKPLKRIIQGQGRLESKLYKNSLKSINALEYVLFTKDIATIDLDRRWESAYIIVTNLVKRLKTVYDIQSSNKLVKIAKDSQWANSIIIDNLIQSSYKLKEWRVGDAAGLSQKYKNNPNNKRLEYYRSNFSSVAIRAILQTHYKIMVGKFHNFGDISKKKNANKEVVVITRLLKKSFIALDKIVDEDFTSPAAKQLFKILSELHNAYYNALINKLNITSKIIDADGD